MVVPIVIVFLLFLWNVGGETTDLRLVGCYEPSHEYRDFSFNVTSLESSLTAKSCVEICLKQFFRYAVLKDSSTCFCNSSHGIYRPSGCSDYCNNVDNEHQQMCLQNLTGAMFDTGQKACGPPAALKLVNATENSIQVLWEPPMARNDEIEGYTVLANCVYTYSRTVPLMRRQWKVANSTFRTELPDLHPGTKYNISVAAHSSAGTGVKISDVIWTQIGEPEPPDVPKIVRRDKGQIVVKLMPATNNNGPISAYRIVVLYKDGHDFKTDMLTSFHEAESEGIPYYIAAELDPKDLKDEFVIGDGRMYGRYFNPPLPPDSLSLVTLGIVSTLNNITKVTYAELNQEDDDEVLILNVGGNLQDSVGATSGMVLGLSIAIGICGFLLLLSVIAYCMLRRHLGQRRRSPDHQELSLQGPMVEVEPNGYIHNGYIPEEEEERVNHYENLKHQVWNIPRNFLDIKSESLGSGRYGKVMKGTVQQRGYPIPVAIHTIADGELPPDEKRSMLKDLGVLIKIGTHTNVASLVGTCENPETLFVVVEYHPASLKDVLLESRCLEHSDLGHARQPVCSVNARQALETAVGIAEAMDYLTSKKLTHTQLAARNILMADGIVPKVTGCGISRYNKHSEKPDYTRWTAQEIFRGRSHVHKSDVWSFGCVLWEITAIGGTPYAEVATCDLPGRVMRGHRLVQLQIVGDDLYQLMLQCWQLDLDERPTFREIAHILENMLDDCKIHLNFEMFPGFHYEPYLPHLERE